MVPGNIREYPSVPVLYGATRVACRDAAPTGHAHRSFVPPGDGLSSFSRGAIRRRGP